MCSPSPLSSSLSRVLAAITALAGALAAQHTITVDPVHGVDRAGNGSSAAPYRTITFAVAHAPTGIVTFDLRPGTYTAHGGERFPIVLPPTALLRSDPATTVRGGRTVIVDVGSAQVAAFAVPSLPVVQVGCDDLVITGDAGTAVAVDGLEGGAFVGVALVDCVLRTATGVTVAAGEATGVHLRVAGCAMTSAVAAIAVRAADGGIVQVAVDRSRIAGGGLELVAANAGLVDATVRASRLIGAPVAAVSTASHGGGRVRTRLESCLFQGAGHLAAGGRPAGAIVDDVTASGIEPTHAIYGCVFAGNVVDVAELGPGYTFGVNLVQQPDLVALGRNKLGTARFVDAPNGDFHLTPDSPGVDAGDAGELTLFVDADGDPRAVPLCGPPDLGPDEVWLDAVRVHEDLRVGRTATFVVTTEPGALFALLFGSEATGEPFGPGVFHVGGVVIATTLAGIGDNRGVGSVAFPVPGEAALVGLETWWQAVVAHSPWLGPNAWRAPVTP